MNTLCELCCRRSKQTDLSFFSEASEIFNNIGKQFPSTDDQRICQCCLGLLQPNVAGVYLLNVENKLNCDRYDASTFNLCVSFPLATFVRDHVLKLVAQKNGVPRENFVYLKDLCKFLYKGRLEKLLNLSSDISSDFNLCLNFTHELDKKDTENIHEMLIKCGTCKRKRFKTSDPSASLLLSRANLSGQLDSMDEEKINQCYETNYFDDIVVHSCDLDASFERAPFFIGGRYIKYSRYVHQTPWTVDGEKRSKDSVQEIISRCFLDVIKCDDKKFTASGREDADVRMLGNGRPFALQFVNARKKFGLDLDVYQSKINAASMDVQVNLLKIVSQQDFDCLTRSDESKVKHYVALCYFCESSMDEAIQIDVQRKIAEISLPLEITQKTPIRVLHRRPLIDRKRRILNASIFPVDTLHFQLFLATEAGTYVKEFVHGDFGRTTPCLGDILGAPVDILELDVEKIDFDWPP